MRVISGLISSLIPFAMCLILLFCNHYHMHAVQVIILQCIAAQLFDPAYHRLFLNHTCLEP